jgi:hypothetical protein
MGGKELGAGAATGVKQEIEAVSLHYDVSIGGGLEEGRWFWGRVPANRLFVRGGYSIAITRVRADCTLPTILEV